MTGLLRERTAPDDAVQADHLELRRRRQAAGARSGVARRAATGRGRVARTGRSRRRHPWRSGHVRLRHDRGVSEGQPPLRFAGGPLRRAAAAPAPGPRRLGSSPGRSPSLPGVRPALAKRLAGFGLTTVGDLLTHYPRRYEDFTDRKPIADLKVGEEATVRATVERVTLEHGHRRRVTLLKAVLRDQSGVMVGVWFNQPWLAKVLEPGMVLSLRGSVRLRGGGASFAVKAHEILAGEGETVHTEGIVPVYPASESISARVLRDLVHEARRAARSLPDPLSGSAARRRSACPPRPTPSLPSTRPARTPRPPRRASASCSRSSSSCSSGCCSTSRPSSRASSAAALGAPGATAADFLAGLPFCADRPPGAGDRRDRRRPRARHADAPPAPGRRRLGQDRGRRAHPACGRSRRAIREPSWRPPRRSPSSTSRRWPPCSDRSCPASC